LLNDLSTKDLVMLGIMFSTKFMKPWRRMYATIGKLTLVPL
jgi:hypothetical protein